MAKVKVQFTEAISCADGSWAAGHVEHIDEKLATAWLKSGTVKKVADATPVTPDATVKVTTPVPVKNSSEPKAPKAPKAPKK